MRGSIRGIGPDLRSMVLVNIFVQVLAVQPSRVREGWRDPSLAIQVSGLPIHVRSFAVLRQLLLFRVSISEPKI
jgi:hypothetical protein